MNVVMVFDRATGEAEPVVIVEDDGQVSFVLEDGRELLFDRTELEHSLELEPSPAATDRRAA